MKNIVLNKFKIINFKIALQVVSSKNLRVKFDTCHHDDAVTCLLRVRDTTIASGSKDKTISIVDISGRKKPAMIDSFHADVRCLAVNHAHSLLVAGCLCDVYICDVVKRKVLLRFTAHGDIVNSISFVSEDENQKSQLLVSASADESLRTWRLTLNGSKIRYEMAARLTGMAVNVDHLVTQGSLIVSASSELQYIKLWDAVPRFDHGTPMYMDDGSVPPSWTSDGHYVVTQDSDLQNMVMHNMFQNGQIVRTIEGHERQLTCFSVTADDEYVISGGVDKCIRMTHIDTGRVTDLAVDCEVMYLSSHPCKPLAAATLNGNSVVLIGLKEHDVTKVIQSPLAGDKESVTAFLLNDSLVIGTSEGRVIVQPLTAHAPATLSIVLDHKPVRCVASSKDGRKMAAAAEGKTTIAVWESDKNAERLSINAASRYFITCVGVSEDGDYVIAGTKTRQVVVWDSDVGTPLTVIYVYSAVTALSLRDDVITVGTRMGFLGRYRLHKPSLSVEPHCADAMTLCNGEHKKQDGGRGIARTSLSDPQLNRAKLRNYSRSVSCAIL